MDVNKKGIFKLPSKDFPSRTRDNVSISERLFVISRIRSSSREEFQ